METSLKIFAANNISIRHECSIIDSEKPGNVIVLNVVPNEFDNLLAEGGTCLIESPDQGGIKGIIEAIEPSNGTLKLRVRRNGKHNGINKSKGGRI